MLLGSDGYEVEEREIGLPLGSRANACHCIDVLPLRAELELLSYDFQHLVISAATSLSSIPVNGGPPPAP